MEQEINECCDWLECQLGDIKTFLGGIEKHIEGDKTNFPGGGNLSVPILIYAYLEYISALYSGTAKENSNENKCDKCSRTSSDYDATKNVKLFVEKFFPDNYKKYPLLFWDGIRNAVTHRFSPKVMTTMINNIEYVIRFRFYVEDNKISSHAKNLSNHIFIDINSFELFEIILGATKDYFSILEYDSQLQNKCLNVWQAIKGFKHDIIKDNNKNVEAQNLISSINECSGRYTFLIK